MQLIRPTRPYGDNPFNEKPDSDNECICWMLGGADRAQYHLRQIFVYLNTRDPINGTNL